MKELRGRTAVITGAAGTVGGALADAFGTEGLRLVLADVDTAGLERTAARCLRRGVEVLTVPTDVTDPRATDRLAETTLAHFGSVHVICNNAGITAPGRLWELPAAEWHHTVAVNLHGVVNGIRSFVPHLVAQDEGHVVNTSSIAGLIAGPGFGAYVATKHAVSALTESLFRELVDAGSRVRATALCPGLIGAGMTDSVTPAPQQVALEPAEVALAAVTAVREERLWVVLPPERARAVAVRAEQIVTSTNPPTTYGL